MNKHEYALKAFEIAESNHISINAFAKMDSEFYERLWRLVCSFMKWEQLDTHSFSWVPENEWFKIPWKTCFFAINES